MMASTIAISSKAVTSRDLTLCTANTAGAVFKFAGRALISTNVFASVEVLVVIAAQFHVEYAHPVQTEQPAQ